MNRHDRYLRRFGPDTGCTLSNYPTPVGWGDHIRWQHKGINRSAGARHAEARREASAMRSRAYAKPPAQPVVAPAVSLPAAIRDAAGFMRDVDVVIHSQDHVGEHITDMHCWCRPVKVRVLP